MKTLTALLIILLSCTHQLTSNPKQPINITKSYLDSVPDCCTNPTAVIDNPTLPANFTTVVPWIVSVHNPKLGSQSCIQIDYLRLFVIDSTRNNNIYTTQLTSTNFTTWNSSTDGGLYSKACPMWFQIDSHAPMPASTSKGILSYCPSDVDSVWHFWTSRTLFPYSNKGVYVEARVLLSGGACLQVGADWWITKDAQWNGLNVNNKDVGCSRWYFADTAWQTISFFSK